MADDNPGSLKPAPGSEPSQTVEAVKYFGNRPTSLATDVCGKVTCHCGDFGVAEQLVLVIEQTVEKYFGLVIVERAGVDGLVADKRT